MNYPEVVATLTVPGKNPHNRASPRHTTRVVRGDRRAALAGSNAASVTHMDAVDVLGLNTLLAQLILAVGAAMVIGNGFAIYQHAKGRTPEKAGGEFRASRAWWLLTVGVLIAAWGGASLAS